ncbi:MAG: DUF4344 domain-containing metallopeptidase [Pseudomonadota bacterium]
MTSKLSLILLLTVMFVHFPTATSASSPAIEFRFEEPGNEVNAEILKAIKAEGFIQVIKNELSRDVSLSEPIIVDFMQLKDPDEGPYYDPEEKKIVIPYHFWTYVYDELNQDAQGEMATDELNILTGDIIIHMLYHEIAHALIDVKELAITGREEDAADELAVLMILDHFEKGTYIALTAADFFELEGSYQDEITDEDLFGEHALDDQRFFNILCLVYGYGDAEAKEIMTELEVDEERLGICEEDFDKRRTAWDKLLGT